MSDPPATTVDRPDPSTRGSFDALQRMGAGLGAKLEQHLSAIRGLGLESYILDFERRGFAVIPPGKVATPEVVAEIRSAVLRIAEQRTGAPHAVDRAGSAGHYTAQPQTDNQFALHRLLLEDPVFEAWLYNPTLRALVDYILRGTAQLSTMMSFVTWKGGSYGETLGIHADSPSSPEGVLPSSHPFACNLVLVLTEYTRENGALAMVPGSHLFYRQPTVGEGVADAVPVEAPVGSLIFWHGNTWHGAYPRTTDGLRLNLTTFFSNASFKTLERYGRSLPLDLIARNDAWFGRIVGAEDVMGWDEHGPRSLVQDLASGRVAN